ncbi:MAG: hypothetical protein VR67_12010 [Peptococcaceae bacterium BRH_c8a]|nr:MAG: hypothetical protein VR67_12010 [Peptococcaceae bacterium BRH_c8a]
MAKIVALLPEDVDVSAVDRQLQARDISNYRVVDVADDYEQQIRQEVFLTRHEKRVTIIGTLAGALAGALLVAWLLQNHPYGLVAGPLLANTIYSSLFAGTGIGLAFGALWAGAYAISRPLPEGLLGQQMLIIFCDPAQLREARNIISRYNAINLL